MEYWNDRVMEWWNVCQKWLEMARMVENGQKWL